MSGYSKLNSLIKNKKILYIPIYSCFDYKTNSLNFKADGNVNRFLTTFFFSGDYKSLTILYPPSGNNIDWFENSCKNMLHDVILEPCQFICKSAKIERSLEFANNVFNSLFNTLENYDLIIVESQHLFLKLYNNGYDNLIYWCPVCATNEKTRDFLEPFKELDRYIFSIAKHTIVASDDQVKYYKTICKDKEPIQINRLISRFLSCFDYQIQDNMKELFRGYDNCHKIFLPFRLTDKGYKMQEIFDYLYNEYRGTKSFKVFYTNPNNCDIYQFAKNDAYKKLFIDNNFILVNKDRDTYYTIIDYCNVIIPYFEDTEFICHAAINEFDYGNCKVCRNIDEFKAILQ